MKVLFLDIDGVLNDGTYDLIDASTHLLSRCINQLNRIIDKTECKIVISSARRYMLAGRFSNEDFEEILKRHGCTKKLKILGRTALDEEIPDRSEQILSWVKANPEITRWMAVDDLALNLGDNLAKTNQDIGLTSRLADVIIRKLNS